MSNPAYPNGRCDGCGFGLSAIGTCTNDDCPQCIWYSNEIQFARLLCEILATQETLDRFAIADEMDLPIERVYELFDRANDVWEKAKGNR